MNELVAPPPHDRRLAERAEGLLGVANASGLLDAADVHVAVRLGELVGEADDRVRLALALAVRAVRTGSVACDLEEASALDPEFLWPFAAEPDATAWRSLVANSPLVAQRVLRLEFGLIYLERYWEQEVLVADVLHERAGLGAVSVEESVLTTGLSRLFPDAGDGDQRAAGESAVRHRTVIVTGGPGTGKTTTIAKIVALLAEQAAGDPACGPERPGDGRARRPLRIALAAPTAKAAARLTEAFHGAAAQLPAADRARIPSLSATTLHRLLGWIPESRSRFKHDRDNRLPHDVVVLDEASMVSLTLMSRLLEALRPTSRLIIAGDPDQLASVEAGAVLADLVAGMGGHGLGEPTATGGRLGATAEPEGAAGEPLGAAYELGAVARLGRTYRFGGAIGELAHAIRNGDAAGAVSLLHGGGDEIRLFADVDERKPLIVECALVLRELARAAGDDDDRARRALATLARHRLLCAHRTGPSGVSRWNRQVEQWVSEETGENFWTPMYAGRPLLVTANDYAMDLYNGYTGVVMRRGARLVAVFDAGASVREVAASRLSEVETMHAATIHKSQGSQAESVTVVLPELDSPLLTRELIYTAVTRAQRELTIIGTPEAVAAGIERPIQRASGLRHRLVHAPGTRPAAAARERAADPLG
ncbi:MAG: exodeoxyribonuclease V subunit alpha [Tetrasphaera sp.]